MKSKLRILCGAAVMTALLLVLQVLTKSMGQFITGSCVNAVLAAACLSGGFWCGAATALISPFAAFLLGIGPALIQIVPIIALGNLSLVAVFAALKNKAEGTFFGAAIMAAAAAAVKGTLLFLLVTKLALPLLDLPEKQAAALALMFSWPQLVTALIGGGLGTIVSRAVEKSRRRG